MSGASGKTVLVADDAAEIRILLTKLLEKRGHRVFAVDNGKDALSTLTESSIKADLILLDAMMPEMTGFETATRLRQHGIEAPIVMLTAMSGDQSMMRGYSSGVDYFIPKPFRRETILNIVDYLIGDLPEEERRRLETQI